MVFKGIAGAARRIIRSRRYWILALLLVCTLLYLFVSINTAIGVFILGIVAISSFKPESFFTAGIAVSIIMGIFLAARSQSLALDASKIAFALMCAGTLLGAWRLWRAGETEQGSAGDE
jgi:hypothetical protein